MKKYLTSIVDLLAFIGLKPKQKIGYQLFLVLCFTFSELFGVILLVQIINFLLFKQFSPFVTAEFTFLDGLADRTILVLLIFLFFIRFLLTRTIILLQLREVYFLLQSLNSFLFSSIVDSRKTLKTEDVIQCSVIESNNICVGYYMQFIRGINELLFLCILLLSVFISAPAFSILLICTCGILLFSLQYYNKRILLRYGAQRVSVDEKRTSLLEFSANSSLELHGYGLQSKALNAFKNVMHEYSRLGMQQQKIKSMQKYWIETIFIMCVFACSLISIYSNFVIFDLASSGPIFAAAILKILPGINRLTSHFNSMHFYKSSLSKYTDFIDNVNQR